MAQTIIPAVDTELISAELTPERFLRNTNKGHNEIYVVDAYNAPNVMREVGRLREIAFRSAGGGTGKEGDIDEYDTMTPPCRQLIVWDPESKLILGGYRFIIGKEIAIRDDGTPRIATSHMFRFSPEFLEHYLPNTLELGRSFVRLEYQSSKAGAKAIFALDNLWDGLGALTVKYFPDTDRLVYPIKPLDVKMDLKALSELFSGNSFAEDYRILNKAVRSYGFNIPPLVNAYMSLSPTMKVFGTAINDEFGDVEETGNLRREKTAPHRNLPYSGAVISCYIKHRGPILTSRPPVFSC